MNATKSSYNVWRCLECEGEPEFDQPSMMKHFQDVHGIDTKTRRCTKTMVMHLDGSDFYQSTYEIDVDGMKFMNYHYNKRTKETRLY